ncbi:succinyl-CoA synthetase alpha subunit [Fusarium oxysporum f. sp. pisi HDV247]|uniref:Succinyl-CoA synthetase alpha subunit n=1 Tax=Fusarium oxysporum f. sp. pisi HDV247 TaxID=1080344 RepID=W9NT55_FUSOX|nr:succinyl-CoA synthetase alpha subunit [Fusarium oxysporum f. sp. pisi HDV247]
MATRPTLADAWRLSRTLLPHGSTKYLSTYIPRHQVYDTTIANLNIGKDTKVIYQGFTGKAATLNAKDTLAYGTNVVGGVSPGKGGQEHLGLPVFNTVREAMEQVNPHATSVFVPAQFAAAAIIEAIEAEVPLVVTVAEHIPVHDILRVHDVLKTQSKTRLVGPNCPGIIAPEQCRIGIMPYKQYKKGSIGIVSKSGTLSYEAVGSTSKAGLGQSLVVGMGGDMMPGTTLVDALKLFFNHPGTEGIIAIGEIGGEAELRAAEAIKDYRRITRNPKPIIAMVAGKTAPEGRTMGHAGALLQSGDISAEAKAKALADSGAIVVPHPGVMGQVMNELLSLYTNKVPEGSGQLGPDISFLNLEPEPPRGH